MKFLKCFAVFGLLLAQLIVSMPLQAQPSPGGPVTNLLLDTWTFADATNWTSDRGYAPMAFTNISNLTNILWIDTGSNTPAYLFYNLVETNGATNLNLSSGSISFWFNPDWDSTNQYGGYGIAPSNWANLISLGQYGTNGSSWWALYFDPSGTILSFAAQTNGGAVSNYFSAQVGLVDSTWYNVVLTYGPTNSALYLNGSLVTNGSGVSVGLDRT